MKLSIIVPCHNEERLIGLCLSNLYKTPYNDYEVIVGFDSCTDNSISIGTQMCKDHPNFKYYIFNERQGKTKMINQLIKNANGEIIIILDCDWKLSYKNEIELKEMLNVFKDPKVCGICDPYPITYPIRKEAGTIETGSTLYGMVWIDSIKNHAQYYCNGYKKLDPDYFPGLVNMFKKSSFSVFGNETLGDDFERAVDILNDGDAVLISTEQDPIRMITLGEEYSLKGIWSQKKRTALARQQLKELYPGLKMNIPKLDLIKSIWRNVIRPCKIKYIWSFGVITLIYILGSIFKPKDLNTTKGWGMRAR